MTQTGYSNAIVNAMLGWLKGLASWVLKLFNLSGGFSPLKFLADHWLQLLILFLVIGVVVDLLVWLIRWRPHWVWLHKKRVIINDKNFFAHEKYVDDSDRWDAPPESKPSATGRPAKPRRNWEDSEFVVPSAQRRRREEEANRRAAYVKSMQLKRREEEEASDVFRDGLFNVNAKQKFTDKEADEVFSVAKLPEPERAPKSAKKTKNVKNARRGSSARNSGRSTARPQAGKR